MKKTRNILLAPFILVWAIISLPWELPKAMARVLSAIEEGSKA